MERMRQLREHASSSSSASRRHSKPSDNRDSKRGREEERESRHAHSHRRRRRSRSASIERHTSRRYGRKHGADDSEDYHRHRTSRVERRRDRSDGYLSRHTRSLSRSRSPRNNNDRHSRSRHQRRKHSSHRTRSPPRSSRSSRVSKNGHSTQYSREDERNGRRNARTASPLSTGLHDDVSQEESDPLEDLVGPLPPQKNGPDDRSLRLRGRGAYKTNASNIDAHFAPDYDPTVDVQLEDDDSNTTNNRARRRVPGLMDDDDDWELALEALRDRARWKQKGEQRLREAGFNDSIVERWKNDSAFSGLGGSDGSLEEVKWSKKGEGREWDRGKVVGEDGQVDVKAPW